MKQLIITRHGKAEDGIGKKDFDRQLTEKGIQQAHTIGTALIQHNLIVDKIIYSSAARTSMTTAILSQYLNHEKLQKSSLPSLYLCDADTLLDTLIANADDSHLTLMIVGHNNGLSDFYNHLCQNKIYHNLSTCETVIICLDIDSWADLYLKKAKTKIISIESPKNY